MRNLPDLDMGGTDGQEMSEQGITFTNSVIGRVLGLSLGLSMCVHKDVKLPCG